MRSALFWKLFLLQLAATALLVGGALALMRAYTAHSFADYVQAQEQERIEDIARRLADRHRHGEDWQRLPPEELQGRPHPPLPPPFGGAEHPRPPPLEGRQGRGELRVALLGPDGRAVSPPGIDTEGWPRVPVEAGGGVIGYVARNREPPPPHPLDAQFAQRQTTGAVAIALAGLLLAAGLAALLARRALRPLQQLSAGTAALARREFGTRLGLSSNDELGRIAEDFNRLAESLERYEQRQRQWLSDVSHELRTPLAVLRGEVEAMLDGVRRSDPPALRSLHQELLRFGALVDELHFLSVAEAGGLRLDQQTLDLAELAEEAAARFATRLDARGLRLSLQKSTAALPVRGDDARLQQVVANLFENALRYAAAPGRLLLTADVEGRNALLSLADSGPGVPDSALPRLFDRLYRVDLARTRQGGGSGLGLAICKSIIEAHGGRISAQRAALGGLEVRIHLPLACA